MEHQSMAYPQMAKRNKTNARTNFLGRRTKPLSREQQIDRAWEAHQRAERPEAGLHRFLKENAERPWMSGRAKAETK
jgi:hypothetical protein